MPFRVLKFKIEESLFTLNRFQIVLLLSSFEFHNFTPCHRIIDDLICHKSLMSQVTYDEVVSQSVDDISQNKMAVTMCPELLQTYLSGARKNRWR